MFDIMLISGVLLAVYIPIGLTVNIFHMYICIRLNRRLPFMPLIDIPVFNLTIIGIIIHTIGLPAMLIVNIQQYVGSITPPVCQFLGFCSYTTITLWNLGFLAISTERYISVSFPSFHLTRLKGKHVWICCSLVYVIGILPAVCRDFSSIPELDEELRCQGNDTSRVIVSVLVPIVCLTTFFLFLWIAIPRRKTVPRVAKPQNTEALKRTRTMFLIYIWSSSCYVPMIIASLLSRFVFPDYPSYKIKTIPMAFGTFGLLGHFIIHYRKSVKFRKEVAAVIRKMCNSGNTDRA